MDYKYVKKIKLFTIVIVVCVIISCINTTNSHPLQTKNRPNLEPLDKETINQLKPCHMNGTTMELCQRCSKDSKADNVFPLCCSNVNGVQSWCVEYMYFGAD